MASPASLAIVPLQQSVTTRDESKLAVVKTMVYNIYTPFTSEDWEDVKEATFTGAITKVTLVRSVYSSIKGLPS